MRTITVKVNSDHLLTLSRTKRPILAIAELIWNGLDADARNVEVIIEDNPLGGLDSIKVIDDGHGLNYQDAEVEFGDLGGSWKKTRRKSKKLGRLLHGRLGKGRFRAFALGNLVVWNTYYSEDGVTKNYTISGKIEDARHFTLSDPVESSSRTGTEVSITNIPKNFKSIRGEEAAQEIAAFFALYLRQYPDVTIKYEGRIIKTEHLQTNVADVDLKGVCRPNGLPIKAQLTIIEWAQEVQRSLYLCDENGFALLETPVGIQARGFNFTAYLKSDYIRELDEEGLLELEELQPQLKKLLDLTREVLKNHFRKRAADEASTLVQQWKEEKIYPYENEPQNPVDEAERHVFDICALNIHSYLPEFEQASHKSKQLAFRLLKNALETDPSAIQIILTEVLDLPQKRQAEFAQLLRQTSLDAIISASKTVADRLTFLRSLELLLFDPDSKKQLLERRQLHRILAEHTWVFGEEFNLTVDDQSLTEVLKKHRAKLGDDVDIVDEVRREDGSLAIVDLVLARRIPTARGDEREHLVVELKRPKHKLNDDSLNQIRNYAFAVASDERFLDVGPKWSFWLISNEMLDGVRLQANQRNLPPGCVYDDARGNIRIWVKTWGQVISDCEGRLKFFQEQLEFRASREDALSYLRKEYRKYIPEVFHKQENEADDIP